MSCVVFALTEPLLVAVTPNETKVMSGPHSKAVVPRMTLKFDCLCPSSSEPPDEQMIPVRQKSSVNDREALKF